jgi:hypothetical protein
MSLEQADDYVMRLIERLDLQVAGKKAKKRLEKSLNNIDDGIRYTEPSSSSDDDNELQTGKTSRFSLERVETIFDQDQEVIKLLKKLEFNAIMKTGGMQSKLLREGDVEV